MNHVLVTLASAADPSQLLHAREQMAFTLGFHIMLVPLGLAFSFLMLVANHRGIRKGDALALLARRWSKMPRSGTRRAGLEAE